MLESPLRRVLLILLYNYCEAPLDIRRQKGGNMENKRLYRSRKNRMIAGVCGGFAEYLNIDPTIVRLVIVLLAIFGVSAGFWIYLIAAIIVPNEE